MLRTPVETTDAGRTDGDSDRPPEADAADDTPRNLSDQSVDHVAEDADGTNRCHALVPVGRRWHCEDLSQRFVAALCYFSWLGWVLAPACLLLLGVKRIRDSGTAVYHIYVATGWSIAVVILRSLLGGATLWLSMGEVWAAGAACNVTKMLDIVLVLSFALLFSTIYAVQALAGAEASLPWISPWAHGRARDLLDDS